MLSDSTGELNSRAIGVPAIGIILACWGPTGQLGRIRLIQIGPHT
jgi:hypothetical protein